MKTILTIILFSSVTIIASDQKWTENNLSVYFHKFCTEVYSAKIINYSFTPINGKKMTQKEYEKYETLRKFYEEKIENFSGTYYEWLKSDFENQEYLSVKKEIIQFEKKTESIREDLIKIYKKELEKYPALKGTFEVELKVLSSHKGKHKKGDNVKKSFTYNPDSMCPHSTVKLLSMQEKIILQNKSIKEVLNMDHLPLLEKVKKKIIEPKGQP